MIANEPQHLETIGHACVTLQASYGAVRRALAEIGAEPALTINGIEHYSEADVQRVAERVQKPARAKPDARQ
jgi:hypothetical protein